MRKKRRFLLFFIPLILLLLFGIAYAYFDYSQIQESSSLNYPGQFNYGRQFIRLEGNLSDSGVPGNDSWRPAFLDRYQATFTENIKTGASYTLDKFDNYNLEETQPSDNFRDQNKEGYGLLPIDQNVITSFLSQYVNATPNQQTNIWNELVKYEHMNNPFDAYGYYELDGNPYYLIPQLVGMAGGEFVDSHSTSTDLSDMSTIKGQATFYLSPIPKINSAQIVNGQLQVDFEAYGYSQRDVTLTIQGDLGKKVYTYYDVTDTTLHDTWTKDVSDFISSTGATNLKVILDDGFYRTDEKPISDALNLAVSDIWYSPTDLKPYDQVATSVLATNQSNQDETTTLVEKLNGSVIGQKTITLNANSSIRVDGFPFQATYDTMATVSFEINPNEDTPPNEITYKDNYVSRDITIDKSRNLFIHFRDVPDSVQWNDMIPVKVAVGNSSDVPITTTVTLSDNYKTSSSECVATDINDHCIKWKWSTTGQQVGDTRSVTIPAQSEVVINLSMPAGWDYFSQGNGDYKVTLVAKVNPSQNQPPDEVTYVDNTATQDVDVNPIGVPKTKVRLYE